MSDIKNICIISETQNDDAWDILSSMFHELIDNHDYGLRILIPDSIENQYVFDAFNYPEKKLHVAITVGVYGKRSKIVGVPNKRSLFVDLKVRQNVKEMMGKYGKPDTEWYQVGRTKTIQNRSEIPYCFVEQCHMLVGLWHTGDILKPITQYANHLGREVVLVDI